MELKLSTFRASACQGGLFCHALLEYLPSHITCWLDIPLHRDAPPYGPTRQAIAVYVDDHMIKLCAPTRSFGWSDIRALWPAFKASGRPMVSTSEYGISCCKEQCPLGSTRENRNYGILRLPR